MIDSFGKLHALRFDGRVIEVCVNVVDTVDQLSGGASPGTHSPEWRWAVGKNAL